MTKHKWGDKPWFAESPEAMEARYNAEYEAEYGCTPNGGPPQSFCLKFEEADWKRAQEFYAPKIKRRRSYRIS